MGPTDKIERYIKNTKVKTNPEVNRAVLNDLLDHLETAQVPQTAAQQPSIWRLIMKNQMIKISAAAVILLAVLVGLTILPTQSAYAQVVEGLRKARTLTYTLIRQTNMEPGGTVSIQVAHKQPCHIRTTTVDGYISILDNAQGKMISLLPETQMYITTEYKNVPKTEPDPLECIEQMKSLPAEADEEVGEKEIDKIFVEGYRVFKDDTIITIWINSDSKELVQIEQEYPSSPGMNYIMRDIRLDENLDDSLFSLTPPAGYKEGPKLSADVAQITEADFINFLKTWIDTTVDKTFPPILWSPEFAKVCIEMGKQGKFEKSWTQDVTQTIYRGNMFLSQIPQEDWRYMGANFPFGDPETPETPVFWYRPVGSETYRVIYADLSVRDVAPEDLPQ